MASAKHYDIVIVGGGPAGTAAAIYALTKGLKVALIERFQPKRRPGESLPPGVEPLFRQLGVWDEIYQRKFIRNNGHYTWRSGDAEKIFHPYGSDKQGEWQGFQIPRDILDAILQQRAQSLGAVWLNPCHIKNLVINHGKIEALSSESHLIYAPYYIDATGRSRLFARNLGITYIKHSSTLIARYGYTRNNCPHQDTLPIFIKDNARWRWYAQVDHNLYAWVHVEPYKNSSEETSYKGYKSFRGSDVTWQIAKQLAGPNFFLVGDAACILDPSAGHGVLRALMTGIMAANAIYKIVENQLSSEEAYHSYSCWVNDWFKRDVIELRKRELFF